MSNQVRLLFIKAGSNTLIQDSGRRGYQKFGVPLNGFMDKTAANIANWLAGNNPDAPLFEITMTGPQISIDNECTIAITGADMSPALNGNPVPMYQSLAVDRNSTLTFGKLSSGCRTYLAFGGKLKVKSWLGSASASAHESDVLTPDSILKKNSEIILIGNQMLLDRRFAAKPISKNYTRVRILPGPEYNDFSGEQLYYFLNYSFVIGKDSNRMGYRLVGKIPDFKPEKEILSSGIIPGTIQITNSAQPIILMADAQTTGGYPRIATIISADMDQVAQLKPGDGIGFRPITLEAALEAWADHLRRYSELT